MPRLSTILSLAVALAESLQLVQADCADGTPCDGIYLYANYPGGYDPNDDALLGINQQVCFCDPTDTLDLAVTFTGTDGIGRCSSSSRRV